MKTDQDTYHSYLLRLCQVQKKSGVNWRVSLEDVQTGELQGYSDLAALLAFFKKQSFAKQDDGKVLEFQPG